MKIPKETFIKNENHEISLILLWLQGCKLWKNNIYSTQTGMLYAIELIEQSSYSFFRYSSLK